MTDTVFHNARVLTIDSACPAASAVLVGDGTVVAVGDASLRSRAPADAREVDCGGDVLAPAFIDAHCHLLAMAAARLSIDCSPAAGVRTISDIQQRLREAAEARPSDGWLRATGYDETQLAERRHPTRRDLDAAVGARPARLLHRSGHAVVLSTRALELAGIGTDTPEPPGGVIERFLDDGSPSGVLLEMGDLVDRAVPPLPYRELAPAVGAVAGDLLAAGVTSICDATHTNGASEWDLFARLQAEGHLPLDVTLMEGLEHLGELPAEATSALRRGHVKVMLRELGGTLVPDEDDLAHIVAGLHARGRDVAIHAVEERAVAAAIAAICAAVAAICAAVADAPRAHRHRIEHAALLPEGGAAAMAAAAITVVTQPAFILAHGDRYLHTVPPERHDRLYPLADLQRAGVRVAASSDAPVGPLAPLDAIRAAVERRTAAGALLGAQQAVTFEQSLAAYTASAADACRLPARGRIAPGTRADFVRLSEADVGAELTEVYYRAEPVELTRTA